MKRICARDGCTTVLADLNPGPFCWPCEDQGRITDGACCVICGEPFVKRSAIARYCGEECKAEGRRRNNRACRDLRVRSDIKVRS